MESLASTTKVLGAKYIWSICHWVCVCKSRAVCVQWVGHAKAVCCCCSE